MNRDVIKLIAMFTMLLNHVAAIFLEPGTVLYEVLTDIGYFTAITMCYFLVEGYRYTHSRKKYGLRLFYFGIISQIPFSMAFSADGELAFTNLNMMFTLLFCFLIICARMQIANKELGRSLALILTLCTLFCDWALFAAIFTQLFLWAQDSPEKKRKAFCFAAGSFGLFAFLSGAGRFSPALNLIYAVLAAAGIGLSGCCILNWYNGKRAEKGRKFLQWFFYLFYPCHLLILVIIRMYMHSA